MDIEIILLAVVGLVNIGMGAAATFSKSFVRAYIRKDPRAFIWRKIFGGEERTIKLSRNVFGPLAIVMGIGMIALAGILIVKAESSSIQFTISPKLHRIVDEEAIVTSDIDYNNTDYLSAIPLLIGEWNGIDVQPEEIIEMNYGISRLYRQYTSSEVYQSIKVAITHAEDSETFHPPDVTVNAIGFKTEEDGIEFVTIPSSTEDDLSNTRVALNKLVLKKFNSATNVDEQQVYLFCYLKAYHFDPDSITTIHISSMVPADSSVEETLYIVKEFSAEFITNIFKPLNQ